MALSETFFAKCRNFPNQHKKNQKSIFEGFREQSPDNQALRVRVVFGAGRVFEVFRTESRVRLDREFPGIPVLAQVESDCKYYCQVDRPAGKTNSRHQLASAILRKLVSKKWAFSVA